MPALVTRVTAAGAVTAKQLNRWGFCSIPSDAPPVALRGHLIFHCAIRNSAF
jgi:hypothetical protein